MPYPSPLYDPYSSQSGSSKSNNSIGSGTTMRRAAANTASSAGGAAVRSASATRATPLSTTTSAAGLNRYGAALTGGRAPSPSSAPRSLVASGNSGGNTRSRLSSHLSGEGSSLQSPAMTRASSINSRPTSSSLNGTTTSVTMKRSASPATPVRRLGPTDSNSSAYGLAEAQQLRRADVPLNRRNSTSTPATAACDSTSIYSSSGLLRPAGALASTKPSLSRPATHVNGMASLRTAGTGGMAGGPVRAFAAPSHTHSQAPPAPSSEHATAAAALQLLKRQRSRSSSISGDASAAPTASSSSSSAAAPVPASSSASNANSGGGMLLQMNAVRRSSVGSSYLNGSNTAASHAGSAASPTSLAEERALRRRTLELQQQQQLFAAQQQRQYHLPQPAPSSPQQPDHRAHIHANVSTSPSTVIGGHYSLAFNATNNPYQHMAHHHPSPPQQLQPLAAAPLSNNNTPPRATVPSALPLHFAARPLFHPPPSNGFSPGSPSAVAAANSAAGSATATSHTVPASASSASSAGVAAHRVNNIAQHLAPANGHSNGSSPAGPDSVRRRSLGYGNDMHAAHFSTLAPVGASAQVAPAPSVSAVANGSVSHRSVLGSMSSQQYHHQRAESRSSITYNSNNYPERSLSEMEREHDLEDELEEPYDAERRIVANSRRSSYDPAKRDGLTTAVGYAAAQAQAQAASPPLSRQVSLQVPAGAIASASSGTRMRALVGLSNLGNTCFLNSTLQCLLSTPAFLPYFASGAYERDINPRGARTRGALAQAFGDLAKKMVVRGSDHSVERPAAVKQAVAIIDNKFSGYGQHDSHEFGRVLLSALHDELNRVVTKPPYEEIKDGENDSDAVKADRWWRNHTERNQSIVMECFAGQLQSSLVCQSCRRRSEAFDPFLDLSLPIPKAQRGGGLSSALSRFSLGGSSSSGAVSRCTLLQCFDEFVREELLTGHEQVYCRACKTHRDHSKKLHVYRWPRMLVLHLKRFSYGSHTRAKINTDVEFPHQLDLRSLAGAAHKQMGPGSAPVYALYGVSAHMGTAAGGHYVAHAKVADADNAPFYTFNDSVVHAEGPNACKGPSAYLLFYRQKD